MKDYTFRLAFLCLILSFLSTTSCSDAYQEDFLDSNAECADWCENTEFADLFKNDGDCMSLCTTCNNPSDSAGTSAVCLCNWYENQYESWEDTPFKNKGQCIKAAKNGEVNNCTEDPLTCFLACITSGVESLEDLIACLIGPGS